MTSLGTLQKTITLEGQRVEEEEGEEEKEKKAEKEEEEEEEEGGDDHSVIEMHLLFLISTCDIVVSVNIKLC